MPKPQALRQKIAELREQKATDNTIIRLLQRQADKAWIRRLMRE